jgi:predicted ester cyclase
VNILNRWFEEVWNQGWESAIDELADPRVVAHGLTDAAGADVVGIEAYKIMFRSFRAALSEIHVAVEQVVTEGEVSVARCVVTAMHTGDGLGRTPKGKPIQFTGMAMVREKDGKIVEAWNNFDFATMFQQME